MAQEPRLDVLLGQRLFEERIVVKINLSHRQVVGGPPIGVDQPTFLV
jgi:hypothetical protein